VADLKTSLTVPRQAHLARTHCQAFSLENGEGYESSHNEMNLHAALEKVVVEMLLWRA
jgi:hypothetical protein